MGQLLKYVAANDEKIGSQEPVCQPGFGVCRVKVEANLVVSVPRDSMRLPLEDNPDRQVEECVRAMFVRLIRGSKVFKRRGLPVVQPPRPKLQTIRLRGMGDFYTPVRLWPTVEAVFVNPRQLTTHVLALWEDAVEIQRSVAEVSDQPAVSLRLADLQTYTMEPVLQVLGKAMVRIDDYRAL